MTIEEKIPQHHEDHNMAEPQDHVEPLHEKDSHKRKPTRGQELIQDAERYGAPDGMHRERKIPKTYINYVSILCDIIDNEPSKYKEYAYKKEWKDSMIEEYQSIIKNDVWEIVLRPKGKSVVTLKWIYKIKHAADGSIKKHKAIFVACSFSQK